MEGAYIEYSCEVKFKGKWAPLMKWKNGSSGTVIQSKDESSENTTKFSIVVEMTSYDNGHHFTCQTYFDKPQSEPHYANNIPINNIAYKELYATPELTVYCKYCMCLQKYHICCILSIFR